VTHRCVVKHRNHRNPWDRSTIAEWRERPWTVAMLDPYGEVMQRWFHQTREQARDHILMMIQVGEAVAVVAETVQVIDTPQGEVVVGVFDVQAWWGCPLALRAGGWVDVSQAGIERERPL
jgi:hypothetical protein